jgi:molybdate transport system substrate-binding protein
VAFPFCLAQGPADEVHNPQLQISSRNGRFGDWTAQESGYRELSSMFRRALFLCCLLLTACGEKPTPARPANLTIACAASLRPAMEEAAAAFQKANPDITLAVTFGASGTFYAQLTQRAPFDVFLSADTEYPRKLITAGHAEEEFTCAVGRLALWVPKESGVDPAADGLKCLLDPSVKRIAIANPRLAPYGRAAEAALRHSGLMAQLKDKLVLAENVSQAAQFVQSGAAQAAIIALSLTLTKEMQAAGTAWTVPEEMHERLEQSGVILPWTTQRTAAETFRAWLLSSEGQAILARHGFTPLPAP